MKFIILLFILYIPDTREAYLQGVQCPICQTRNVRIVDNDSLYYAHYNRISNYTTYLARCNECLFIATEDDFEKEYTFEEQNYILNITSNYDSVPLDHNPSLYFIIASIK
ncbi:hypothetical protein [Flammeovirga aprica]|uniref:Uncharacterized protein n=1 Tax=Flammeovirga aprica JL-4 TaxID=694437 RepID=A0A7X9P3T6_9BACT|nr:hypothetical protein [Flammeovirga aprica]NME68052.1 hypothetical protein [Flammeovirga aprica JL-4]